MRTTLAAAAALLVLGRAAFSAPAPETVDIADMTWTEVRDALSRGYRIAIVPTGGIEQNGPHMIVGKHDYIVRWTAREIARGLGNALVAPVVSYVPEGDYEPPTGHMQYPGTIGVPEPAFAAVLDGVARSLKAGGFKVICFIADHGGSVKAQAETAARLSRLWAADGVRVIDIDAYYKAGDAQIDQLKAQGETAASVGDHAGIADTSELMAVNPNGVDLSHAPRPGAGQGASGDPAKSSAERGAALLSMKVAAAVKQIRSLTSAGPASTSARGDRP